jgi:hypothetical protein
MIGDKMAKKNYAIDNLNGYATQMREAAASSISSDYHNDNLDEYITIDQIINLVRNECIGFDEQDRPVLDEDSNETIFEKTATWIHNVGLAKLAAKDLVECAWDDKSNEMVFWQKESKKEKKPNAKSRTRNKNLGDKKQDC